MAGYLFVHFTGEHRDGEQIYFSVSRDGLHWQDLNGGRPVLYSQTGMCGVRDPFLIRDPRQQMFYLIATDLRIEAGLGWSAAVKEGSRDLIVWRSKDLVHWEKEEAHTVGVPEAGCVWAPEAVYDKEREEFLVFFASMTRLAGETEGKHRIYAVWTKDFRKFSEPFVYLEREKSVIDTTILEDRGVYYRISKDEVRSRLILERADQLTGTYTRIPSELLEELAGVEGPEGYLLPDGRTWCVIADRFAEGKGYLPLLTQDLASGIFTVPEEGSYDMGTGKKRHGGVLPVTDEEYERLLHFYGRENPAVDGLYADPDLLYLDGVWYLYPTTDGYPGWTGHTFSVFSSRDGWHFEKKREILDVASDQVPWALGYAWAPCIAQRDGLFYFYFCAKDRTGMSCIGAAVSKSPVGPFRAQPEPMITMESMRQAGIAMSQTIDPSVYEEDGVYYLLFGNGGAAVARLSADMVHIENNTLRNLSGLTDFREAVSVCRRGGIYHFTWSCDDTGSEDYHVNYGTSDSLYGPVHFEYPVLQKDVRREILGTGHHCICRVGGEDRYVMAYHRFAMRSGAAAGEWGWHREVCTAPMEFGTDGKMQPVLVL